jgi:MFS family permease
MNVLGGIETTAPAARAGIYHGWLVVGTAFLIALFGWRIGFYGPGIYLVALKQRHGWTTADISSAITTYYLLGATLILFAGGVFERFGARRVVFAGAAAMACGAVLLTFVSRTWHVYAAFAVMSFGWAAMSGAAINIIIAPWFDRRRGLAVSLALNGASAGGVVIAPLLVFLIGRVDFAAALFCVAALMLATVLPAAAFVLGPGVPMKAMPQTRGRARREPGRPLRRPPSRRRRGSRPPSCAAPISNRYPSHSRSDSRYRLDSSPIRSPTSRQSWGRSPPPGPSA